MQVNLRAYSCKFQRMTLKVKHYHSIFQIKKVRPYSCKSDLFPLSSWQLKCCRSTELRTHLDLMGITNGPACLEKICAGEEWVMTQKCACLSDGGRAPSMSDEGAWKLFKSNAEHWESSYETGSFMWQRMKSVVEWEAWHSLRRLPQWSDHFLNWHNGGSGSNTEKSMKFINL